MTVPKPELGALTSAAADSALNALSGLADLPPELRPVQLRHAAFWEIGYEPRNRCAPYTARPRSGEGRTLHADTARLLDRVLPLEPNPLDS